MAQNKANFATINATSLVNIKAFHVNRVKIAEVQAQAKDDLKAEDGRFQKAIEGMESVPADMVKEHDANIKAIGDKKAETVKGLNKSMKSAIKALIDEESTGIYGAYSAYHTTHSGENKYKDAIRKFLESMGVESGEKGYSFMIKEIELSCGKELTSGKALIEKGNETRVLTKDKFNKLVVGLVYDILVKKGIITPDADATDKADNKPVDPEYKVAQNETVKKSEPKKEESKESTPKASVKTAEQKKAEKEQAKKAEEKKEQAA